jgi:tRNA threonylcarbamoyladenosine biosynthesis protein TsaE
MLQEPLNLKLPDSRITEELGAALACAIPNLSAGAVVYLHGELGAGKTSCVRSLLRGLGVTAPVRSPTYTLVDTYDLAGLLCTHVDLYRLSAAAEVLELGLRELTGPRSLMLIEWPENGGAAIPAADMHLHLLYAGEGRSASLTASSPVGELWLRNLGHDTRLAPYVSNLT